MQRPASNPEKPVSMWAGLREIYRHLSPPRRRQFYLLLALMLLGAAAELGTIGSVVPFLALLAGQSPSGNVAWITKVLGPLGSPGSNLPLAGLVFVIFVLASGVLRLQLTWVLQKFTHSAAHELTMETQRRILSQPYAFHIERNSSALVSSVDMVEILVHEVALPLMQMLTASFTAAVIVAALVYMDPFTAAVGAATFVTVYLIISVVAGKRLARNSAIVGESYRDRLKIIQESIGGIRDTIIDHSQPVHLGFLDRVNSRLADARAMTAFIAHSPRYVIESIGIVTVAAIAAFVSVREGGLAPAVPYLGALGLGAQRLLPLLQNVYTSWSTASGSRSSVGQVLELLRLPEGSFSADLPEPIQFRDRIEFEGVSFHYPGRSTTPTVQELSFRIPAGTAVAITGKTGAGKSTLADLLMALLEPDGGRILVDGTPVTAANAGSWQRNIAHVPQSIFLADTTIERNIALGLPQHPVDRTRIVEAAKKAQLDEFVRSLADGYETLIGERGIRLSGGQRQRLGLARAIYKQTPLLVLDEATSALDEATETAVIQALDDLRAMGRTIVIIAHRRSTIAHCDLVVHLDKGRVTEIRGVDEVRQGRKTS